MSVPSGIDGVTDLVEIGRGGFGIVYRGVEEEFGRNVAVKVLSSHFDEDARRRFDRERRAMGSVTGHPNVVTVFRDGTTDAGEPYLVMEFMQGGSLADRLEAQGPVPWREAAGIGAKLADALVQAHDSGILHRDVKPANVLCTSSGEPKLGDFGIARLDDGFETQSGSITASIAHVPPELLEGARADERSDVYSLASTVHTLVAGRPPFHRDDDDSIAAVLGRISTQPPPPLALGAEAAAFESVVRRGLEKRPDARYASAREFGEALRTASSRPTRPVPVAPQPVATPPVAPATPLPEPAPEESKNTRTPLLIALGVLVVAIVGGLLIGRAVVGDSDPVAAPIPTPTAVPTAPTPTVEPDGGGEAAEAGANADPAETPEDEPTATPVPTPAPTATPQPTATPVPTPTPNTFGGLRNPGGGSATALDPADLEGFVTVRDTSGTITLGAPEMWAADVFSSSNPALFFEVPTQQRVAALSVGGEFGAVGGANEEREFDRSGVVVVARRVAEPIDQIALLDTALDALGSCGLTQRSELLIPALGTADVELLACEEPGNPTNVVGFIVIAIVPEADPTLPVVIVVQVSDEESDTDIIVQLTATLMVDGSLLPPL